MKSEESLVKREEGRVKNFSRARTPTYPVEGSSLYCLNFDNFDNFKSCAQLEQNNL